MTVVFRKFATMMRLPPHRRSLILEAIMLLAFARVWLILVPFRKVAARLGTPMAHSPPHCAAIDAQQRVMAREIRRAIDLAAARVPFRAVCLQRAVVAKLMLRRRNIPAEVSFGLVRGDDRAAPLRAHAWVDAGCVKVSGYPMLPDTVPVARFV